MALPRPPAASRRRDLTPLHGRHTRRQKYSARAFYLTLLVVAAFTAFSFLSDAASPRFRAARQTPLHRRDDNSTQRDLECRLVHHAKDKCAFVRANCPDEEAGIFSYLTLYYCRTPKAQPVAFAIMVLWLGLLFSTIGIAASDFFCVNLSTISNLLGMSESMAGVTFLAFGNGSPDVFSTFAAMSTNSGSLAVGELFGAAGFITAVVAGSMALVRPFQVAKKSFIRDVGFFIVAASFSIVFLHDGKLFLWECLAMVAFYIFYVVFVVIWHWWLGRRRRRRQKIAAARGNYVAPGNEEVEFEEEYRDDDEDGAAGGGTRASSRRVSVADFSALERGGDETFPNMDLDQEDDTRERWMGELSSNMRLSRPRLGHRRTTVNPIRPSLVGALEFRAVLSSLQKSRNIQTMPMNLRRYSDDLNYTSAQQQDHMSSVSDPAARPPISPESSYNFRDYVDTEEPEPKPLSWWPYKILPPPGVLISTLFPTLYTWRDKNIWEKFLGIVAAPSVLLLTITLPVVEGEKDDGDEDQERIPDLSLSSSLGATDNGTKRTGASTVTILEPESPGIVKPAPHPSGDRSMASARSHDLTGHGNTAAVATHAEHHHRDAFHNNTAPNMPSAPHILQSPQMLPNTDVKPATPKDWNRWLVIVQVFTAPFFIVLIVWANSEPESPRALIRPTLYSLLASLVTLAFILTTTSPTRPPRWRVLLCFLGFVVSISWISTIANEVVGVLKTLGVVLNMSDAILGLTIFAVGNSLGDLVADITVARLGYPVMALSACFGGPMLNILLGIGISGSYMSIMGAEKREHRHPGTPMKFKPYHIDVSSTLLISGATLLVTLVGLLVLVPFRKWKMDRWIGCVLICLWTVSTIGNIVVEVLGYGGHIDLFRHL
ncbi:hypothetical protein W97_04160 [Coniosporium apollinis CBS 100218]|uniref:Sodium/calcium exchanger membrane region domain-containing protein n=1 Tax=Coniosporium apollinis (strain CBS 100218) TaxID=1168221 RepID=R7YTB1_CONA1|nr:uncharacterized protein W97_04160 [Coniosporium apollinis CBS 100218]EON64926.1 hypothetical protein W97_04160 [Coniosporium apollinis CBS 100218]